MLILLSRTVIYTFTKLLNEMMYRRFHEHLNKEKKEKEKKREQFIVKHAMDR